MSREIKTKKQFEDAKFLGKKLSHKHKWRRFIIKKGRNKKKWVKDETGAFLKCSICDDVVFLNSDQLKKYRSFKKQGKEVAISKSNQKP